MSDLLEDCGFLQVIGQFNDSVLLSLYLHLKRRSPLFLYGQILREREGERDQETRQKHLPL